MSVSDLLFAYLKARPRRPRQTLLEIAGQSNKEHVWSRLLAHFLDPRKDHGMSPVFLRALTQIAGCMDPDEVVETVDKEVLTEQGKFIDVLVTTDKRIIAVENKLYAPAYNDFDEYRRETKTRAETAGRRPLLLLLTLYPVDRTESGFVNVNWGRLHQEIVSRSGFLFAEPVEQHTLYLQEFMSMVSNVRNERKVDDIFIQFVLDHRKEVKDLLSDIQLLSADLRRGSTEFGQSIAEARSKQEPVPRQYREPGDQLVAVTYFELPAANGAVIAIDVVFEPQGVRVEIFCRNRPPSSRSSSITEFLPRFEAADILLRNLLCDWRYEWGKSFHRNIDPAEIVREVQLLIETIKQKVLTP